MAVEEGAGTFIIDLDRLGEYGRTESEVWRKPTPPAPPPVMLTRYRTRDELIADARGLYEGAATLLLVYGESLTPSQLLELLDDNDFDVGNHQLQYVYEHLAVNPDGEWAHADANGQPTVHQPGVPPIHPPLAKIEDACQSRRVMRERLYSDGHQQKLPRHLEFPASNVTGVPNPFARMPAAGWFGDVYS